MTPTMKKLLLLITFSLLCLFSFTQINVQQDQRVNRILKSALASKSGYYIYGRTTASRFINIAILNQSTHTVSWFTCHGRLFDSTKITDREYEQVTSRQLDPFTLYQHICDSYLAEIATARDIYRVHGDKQSFDRLNSTYRAVFAMESVQAAKTPLQKLIAIENVRKHIFTQLGYLNCANPSVLSHDPLYATNKEQAGIMVKTNDSTVYYNIDPTSAVAKISLYKKSAGQFYVQNRSSEIIDSVAIQPEKYDLLQKEKTDVFVLYRGWLEMQWQGALSAIRRQNAGLYNQVNVQNEKEVKELYSQLNAIGAKINQLNSPEAKSIEQAVYDTYKNETSEINYIPLLGIGYSLTQTRGQKEYELTNHLGNVLVTVTDKKIGVSSASNNSLIDHYEPDIVSAQDYYPFGMLQPGRSYLSSTGDKYRYGFNGKENDNEVKGKGNQQDYGMRIYDPRLGRFLSVDPLTKSYPMLTPYQFASNRPIDGTDLDGKEWSVATVDGVTMFTVKIKVYNESGTFKTAEEVNRLLNGGLDKKGNKIEGYKDFAEEAFNKDFGSDKFRLKIQFELMQGPSCDYDKYNEFQLILRETTSKENDDGTVSYSGGAAFVGRTQKNHLYSTLVVDGGKVSDRNLLFRNFLHELLHSGGLRHPWEKDIVINDLINNPGFVKMLDSDKKFRKFVAAFFHVDPKKLLSNVENINKKNIMNSDERREDVPIPGTHDPKDKDIRKSQYKKIEATVSGQQPVD
jgi:RHS repeat-associated protein